MALVVGWSLTPDSLSTRKSCRRPAACARQMIVPVALSTASWVFSVWRFSCPNSSDAVFLWSFHGRFRCVDEDNLVSPVTPDESLLARQRDRRSFPGEQFLDTSGKFAGDRHMIALNPTVCLNQTVRESVIQNPPLERHVPTSSNDDDQSPDDNVSARRPHRCRQP